MATLGSTYLNLADLFKRSESDDELRVAGTVIELLSETNPVLEDAMAVECNLGTRHRTTVRTGLPSVTWGKLYSGVAQSKSTTAQVEDTTGFVEGLSTIDARLLELAGEREGAVRLSEAQAFLEALNQEMASTIFYGDHTNDPEKFTGLAPRFNSTSAANGDQIVDGSGSGSDNTSVWFVTWADTACHLIYPQGTAAGISREDMGMQRVLDGSSNPYYAKEEMFRWHAGLTVRDWRQVVRIANIDVSDLAAGTVDIFDLFGTAYWRLHQHRVMGGRMAIYCNANVCEALDKQATPTKSSQQASNTTGSLVRLTPDNQEGKEVMAYRGMPIRQTDALLNTESQVT